MKGPASHVSKNLASRVSRPCLALALVFSAGGALGDRPLPANDGGHGATALPFPFDSTMIVVGREATAEFAAKELNEIVAKAAGREFQKVGGESRWTADDRSKKVGGECAKEKVGGESRWTKDGSGLDCNSNTQKLKNSNTSTVQPSTSNLQPSHRIFLGRSPEAERILGADAFAQLGEEESCVFAKGNL